MSAEPTLPVSQPAPITLKMWLIGMFPGADLEHMEISAQVVIEIAESYAKYKLAERDRELQQARELLDSFRTVTDYARSESGSGPGDLQGYIEQLWANRGDAASQLSEAREEIARLKGSTHESSRIGNYPLTTSRRYGKVFA